MFFCADLPRTSRGHTEAARKVSPHYESGGRSWPLPPTKALAHPSFWVFSAGGLWDGGLRVVIFGCGFAQDIPWANKGRSQSLAAFRVRRMKLAPSPHQGYSPPLVLGIFRWGVVGRGPSGALFGSGFAQDIPRAHGGHSQSLAPLRVWRTKLAPAPHQGYSPPLVLGIFRWGVVGRGPSGARFWTPPCPQPIFGTRRPLAKSHPIPSPADEVGPSPPPRL